MRQNQAAKVAEAHARAQESGAQTFERLFGFRSRINQRQRLVENQKDVDIADGERRGKRDGGESHKEIDVRGWMSDVSKEITFLLTSDIQPLTSSEL
jgi:hypothetical protein